MPVPLGTNLLQVNPPGNLSLPTQCGQERRSHLRHERLTLGEWNGNVAEIGTENSGSGSSRALAFITASTTRMTIGATGNVSIGTTTFSLLGTCNSSAEGSMRPVTDSTTSTLGATVSGSGSNHVLAYCDGTNWTVMAR
jgi:hypothetical protein